MRKRLRIINERIGVLEADILEERNPRTARAVWDALPFEAKANTWGDEIYFSIPVKIDEENAQSTVEIGDIGYWPPGQGFCIFFGPTPISCKNEIRPADPVNVFGKVKGNLIILKKIRDGDKIRVEKYLSTD